MWHPSSKYCFEASHDTWKHRIDPAYMQFCRAHKTVSISVWSDSVREMQWRRRSSDKTRAERKISEIWRQTSLFDLGYLQVALVLEPDVKRYPMQNWTGYNLMLSFAWESLVERSCDRKPDEIPFSKSDFSRPSGNFIPEVDHWNEV